MMVEVPVYVAGRVESKERRNDIKLQVPTF